MSSPPEWPSWIYLSFLFIDSITHCVTMCLCAYLSVCNEIVDFGIFVSLYFYLEGKCICCVYILVSYWATGYLFLKVELEIFHIFWYFSSFLFFFAPIFMDPLEACEMQFTVCIVFHIWTMRFMNWKAPNFIAVLSHPYAQTGCRNGICAQAYECKNHVILGGWILKGQMFYADPMMGCMPHSLLSHLQRQHHVVKVLQRHGVQNCEADAGFPRKWKDRVSPDLLSTLCSRDDPPQC